MRHTLYIFSYMSYTMTYAIYLNNTYKCFYQLTHNVCVFIFYFLKRKWPHNGLKKKIPLK